MEKIEKVGYILDDWRKRDLSLFGKVQVIKTFAMSQFVLSATLLVVPPNVVKIIETMFYKFLWGNRDKVKRLKVVQDLKAGGLNMVDVRSSFMSFKAMWINRLLLSDPNIYNWSQLGHYYIRPFLMCNKDLIFNFDDSVDFPEVNDLVDFYKDVIVCYNKVFVNDINDFRDNISNQCIWGNKYIVVRKKKRKSVLFLRNWIRSGINKIRDLQFIDGKLDVDYIYRQIRDRHNILSEIFIIKEALLPFQHCLKSITPVRDHHVSIPKHTKGFYVQFRDKITRDMPFFPNYLRRFCNDNTDNEIFKRKIVLEKEIKLKEFNFKLLHGILPCNLNLYRWKLKTNDSCDVCGQPQTLEHLIWSCPYVRPLWNIIENVCGVSLNYPMILGIEDAWTYDNLFTLVSFLIYKEWLLLSLKNKCRSNQIMLNFYKEELSLRLKIYESCANFPKINVMYIMEVIHHIH